MKSREAELESELREMYEAQLARGLLMRLMQTIGERGHDSILPYIAEGYEVELDCLDRITEWKPGEIPVTVYTDENRCYGVASVQVKTDESEADSNDYLTVELIKEGEDWKICFMGIEK